MLSPIYVTLDNEIKSPDIDSIVLKNTINISYLEFDVSASGYSSSVLPNYTKTGVTVVVPREEGQKMSGSVYYTPLYSELINYDVWKSRINKNFQELR